MFQPFEHGPMTSVHNPGVGIGLSLVAKFAQLHDGRVWVEDREGGGASFRVLHPEGRPRGRPRERGAGRAPLRGRRGMPHEPNEPGSEEPFTSGLGNADASR